MSNFEFLSGLETSTFQKLIDSNVIRPTVRKEMEIYAYFNSVAARLGRMQARTAAAEKFCTSEETIKRVIKRLN